MAEVGIQNTIQYNLGGRRPDLRGILMHVSTKLSVVKGKHCIKHSVLSKPFLEQYFIDLI